MLEKSLPIINKLGLHARAAAKLVNLATQYTADITVHKNTQWANAKSIMGLMMLGANRGTTLLIKADGDDADTALEKITELFDNKFGEVE